MKKSKVIIGQDVIELVGNAMYLDPLVIFREYIQNSVDAIDAAVNSKLLRSIGEGYVNIDVDPTNRTITIRDNGIGIPDDQFTDLMLAIGGSNKRYTTARGFRGVGRLAGLGFCQELIFRTRAVGGKVSQLKWDIRKMKTALAETGPKGDITDLIRLATESETLDSSQFPDHFFEVELRNPLRLGKDILLNKEKVRSYVGQVSPVPYSPTFKYADQIREFLVPAIDFGEYPIFLNDEYGQVFKPYDNEIKFSETKSGRLQEIEFFDLGSLDGEGGAVGWVAHHDYLGAIPARTGVGGLRAKVGNLQIGERRVFAESFPEERFNSWVVGEVHIFDKRLVPNGRRDGFEHGNHWANLKSQLLPLGHEVARRCRMESSVRNQAKKVELALLHAETIADMLDQNAISKSVSKAKISEAKGKIAEAKKVHSLETSSAKDNREISNKIDQLEKRFSIEGYKNQNTDPLGHIPKGRRKAFEEIFDLIYACSSNSQSAKTLIDNILKRL